MRIFEPVNWLEAQNIPQLSRYILADGSIVVLEITEDERHPDLPEEVAEIIAARDAPPGPEQIIAIYDTALTTHLDAVAQSRRYESRTTCALRAAYPGPWQAEGTAFAVWMDACNAQAYQLMDSVLVGEVPLPSIEDFVAALPLMIWPE